MYIKYINNNNTSFILFKQLSSTKILKGLSSASRILIQQLFFNSYCSVMCFNKKLDGQIVFIANDCICLKAFYQRVTQISFTPSSMLVSVNLNSENAELSSKFYKEFATCIYSLINYGHFHFSLLASIQNSLVIRYFIESLCEVIVLTSWHFLNNQKPNFDPFPN